MSEITVHHGDSRDVLKTLADSSVHAVVCDPPYALVSIGKRFGADNAAASKPGKTGAYARASAGFMGQKWDTGETAFAVEFWAEVYRVLKPGGHVVAFSATRTYHRLACAVEDAGFEIRDMVAWLYGSGFPKSHDVAKGIDRVGGISPKDQSALLRERREAAGFSRATVAKAVGCSEASVANWEDGRARGAGLHLEWITPSAEYRAKLADLLGYSEDQRELIGLAADRRSDGTVIGLGHSGEVRRGGVSPLAAEWQGWGTALKPALEPIVFARKPLDGTVAANVLAHGVGALNIDDCRIDGRASQYGNPVVTEGWNLHKRPHDWEPSDRGRWPANVIHDGSAEVAEAFPIAPGQQGVVTGLEPSSPFANVYGDMPSRAGRADPRGDSGSAARFFYSAKADAEDRLGSKHPTVKPIDLMAWLCRLVTPPGGVILDPFAGTGTTGLAAMREGFDCILIEREAQYVADINRRLAWARGEGRLTAQETGRAKAESIDDLPLFGGQSQGLHHIGPIIARVAADVLQKAQEQDQDKGEAA